MQLRALLPSALVVIALLAGCAQPEGPAAEFATDVTAQQAAELFAAAVANMPDTYGIHFDVVGQGARLMEADAVYDGAAQTVFFRAKLDEMLTQTMQGMGGMGGMGMGGMMPDLGEIVAYTSRDGSALLLEDRVVVAPPGGMMDEMADGHRGMGMISDPEGLFLGMEESGLEVQNVTATTIRDRPAIKIVATFEEEGARVPVTAWMFQEPARLARIQLTAPTVSEDDPFSGSVATMDVLYDDEIGEGAPAGLVRALGLRYATNAPAFAWAESYGGSDRSGGEETSKEIVWTFEVDGGIPLAEVRLEADGEPVLTLSDLTAEREGLAATYTDADGDGLVSAGDTLTMQVTGSPELALHDTVSGLKVVPGAGLLLAALALAGVALLLRRR